MVLYQQPAAAQAAGKAPVGHGYGATRHGHSSTPFTYEQSLLSVLCASGEPAALYQTHTQGQGRSLKPSTAGLPGNGTGVRSEKWMFLLFMTVVFYL